MCANNVGGLDRLLPSTGALVKDALDFSDAPSHPLAHLLHGFVQLLGLRNASDNRLQGR